jgi:hypothetical protein
MADIRTEHLLNKSVEHYHYSSLLGPYIEKMQDISFNKPEREADPSLLSTAQVNNGGATLPPSPYVLIAWCLID